MVEEYLQEIERAEENDEEAKASNARKPAKQCRQKRKRIPGVEVAMVVDPSAVQGKEPSKLPKIPKGMGRSSVLVVVGRFLSPSAFTSHRS